MSIFVPKVQMIEAYQVKSLTTWGKLPSSLEEAYDIGNLKFDGTGGVLLKLNERDLVRLSSTDWIVRVLDSKYHTYMSDREIHSQYDMRPELP